MGGNALKNIKIVRISLLKLNELKGKIRERISDELDIDFMIENPEKKDFGDLDIITPVTAVVRKYSNIKSMSKYVKGDKNGNK